MVEIMYGVALLAFFQPNQERFFAAMTIAVTILAHNTLFFNAEGLLYYGSAALFDCAAIYLLMKIDSRISFDLQVICIASMICNFVGWLLWFAYIPHYAYNMAHIVLYIAFIFVLTSGDEANVGGGMGSSTSNCRRFRFYCFNR